MTLAFCGALCLAAGGTALYLSREFGEEASKYNLGEVNKMEVASEVVDRHGETVGKFYIMNRRVVALDNVAPCMIDAVTAAEDRRFWEHGGVDPLGILRAALTNIKSGRVMQGASTITQQLARNSFSLKGKNYRRKMLEMALARRLEESMGKKGIMEAYLNRIYFGSGFYGVESAARGYFGVPAKTLNPAQAATLAAVVRSPNALSPFKNPASAAKLRNAVLRRMAEEGSISPQEAEKWCVTELHLAPKSDPSGKSYALEMIRREVIKKIGFDKTMNGGLRIESTLDREMQKMMEKAVSENMLNVEKNPLYKGQSQSEYAAKKQSASPAPPEYVQAAAVAVENKTAGILALVGGRSFGDSEFNRAVQMKRPPFHAFTPFVLLASLESGAFAGSLVEDWPMDNKFVGIGGEEGILGEWGVECTSNRYEGPLMTREAFVAGKNSAIARLGFRAGLEKIAETSSRLGLEPPDDPPPNTVLGAAPVSPLQLARAYTVFPREGDLPAELYLVGKITSPEGTVLCEPAPPSPQKEAFPKTAVYQVHSMMEEGMSTGPASKARTYWGLENANAVGRSGTSYGFKDAWFAGYDANITCAVWVGFDLPSEIFEGAFGSLLAAPIWARVMNWSAKNMPGNRLLPPFGLKKVEVCRLSGEPATPSCSDAAPFQEAKKPREEYDLLSEDERPPCHLHSGRVKSYTKAPEQSEWPRAAQMVDLSLVRPVNISSRYVEGLADPYNSVSPSIIGTAAVSAALPATPEETPVAPAPPSPAGPTPPTSEEPKSPPGDSPSPEESPAEELTGDPTEELAEDPPPPSPPDSPSEQ